MTAEVEVEVDNKDKSLWRGGAWKLFISRALTAWGDRLWAFGFGLMLIKMHPQNFTVIAAFGLANMLSSIFFGAAIGEWIDNNQRLFAARTFLIIQNTFVAIACIVFALQFIYYQEIYHYAGVYGECFIIALLFLLALIANLASCGSKIVVEKDWIVVIAGGDDDKLAKLNSIFRTIDLVCLNLSPALAGVSFDYAGYPITAGIIATWNIVSVVVEFTLLTSIYKDFEDLARKTWEVKAEEEKRKWYSKFTGSYSGWSFYLRHKVRNAGLGLAFLFMTVLGFDNITWAFSLKQCVSETVLGFLLGASALVGIAGSLVYPHLKKCLGNVERGGIFGMLCLVCSWKAN